MNSSPNSERSRLARELHDGLAQELAAVGYQLDQVIGDLKLDNRNRRVIREIRLSLSGLINQVRNEIFDLRSDFSKSSNQLISEQIQTVLANAEITFNVNGDIDLDSERKFEILRAIRELTTNAKRHASSSHIQVDLSDQIISISDNGIGGNLTDTTGYGLLGIKERLQLIGAELFINSNSSGTRAEIRFM
jgi:signal transduction histidine kinase